MSFGADAITYGATTIIWWHRGIKDRKVHGAAANEILTYCKNNDLKIDDNEGLQRKREEIIESCSLPLDEGTNFIEAHLIRINVLRPDS